MTRLEVQSEAFMGPLDVWVYQTGRDALEFVLSSGEISHTFDVEDGALTIIARRPDGSKLRRSLTIEGVDAVVSLVDSVGPSPNEFMARETLRGLVAPTGLYAPDGPALFAQPLMGAVNRGFASAAISMARPIQEDVSFGTRSSNITLFSSDAPDGQPAQAAAPAAAVMRRLVGWGFEGRWRPLRQTELNDDARPLEASENFLKASVRASFPLALGLVDDTGFGPIVMIPPFRFITEVSFIAKALALRAADRRQLDNGARAPASLAVLDLPQANDLLAALSGPATPPAATVWAQTKDALTPDGSALFSKNLVDSKFDAPAEAILGAHYLLRFLPDLLPQRWAVNLSDAAPAWADGPVIAAWRILLAAPDAFDAPMRDVDETVERLLREALNRPITLFARTRTLLYEGLALLKGDVPKDAVNRLTRFRRYGADAGGFECFWGRGPETPGEDDPALAPEASLATIKQLGWAFEPWSLINDGSGVFRPRAR